MSINPQENKIIPKRVFIVPYRNRLQHKFFFSKQMGFILEDDDDYEIYFSHQCDRRHFNRGATRNIGFLAMREKYPDNYKEITFIFNDVDTLPFHKIFDYQTTVGVVNHYYGFDYALGGIVVIKGVDFERINGYPNFWGWGNEDSVLQKRCLENGIHIDRSNFYTIGSPEILQLFDGVSRLVSPREYHIGKNDGGIDGISSIRRLTFSIDNDSMNPKDNVYKVENPRINVINILSFLTIIGYETNEYFEYDLRKPSSEIISPMIDRTDKIVVTTDDWKKYEELTLLHGGTRHDVNKGANNNGTKLVPSKPFNPQITQNRGPRSALHRTERFAPKESLVMRSVYRR